MMVLPPEPDRDAEDTVEVDGLIVPVKVITSPAALDEPVTTTDSAELVDEAPVAEAAAPNPGKKLGEYVAVPAYCGQPGTVVLGGARPPPQSRKSQSSPVPGTYQISEGPAVEDVQPERSVRAVVRVKRVEIRREVMMEGIFILLRVESGGRFEV